MVTYPWSAKVPTLSSELGESAGRMCVWRASARSCVIGSIADAVMFVTWPNAIVVVDCCASVTFMENGDISIVGKGSNAEEQVG